MKQLRLPFDSYIDPYWWKKPNLWKDRHEVSTIERPTEDTALDNVFYASSTIAIDYKSVLSGIEQRIFELELRSLKQGVLPRWYTSADRHLWIAKQARMPLNEVKGVLDNVSHRLWCIA